MILCDRKITMFLSAEEFKYRTVQALKNRERLEIHRPDLIPAAVLMPFYEKQGSIYLLLTERTDHVAHHKGQISFPGGARDSQDLNLLGTARRESREEIGLDEASTEILGALDDTPTMSSNFLITPFVAFLNCHRKFCINPKEVKQLVEVSLATMLANRCLRSELQLVDGKPELVMGFNYDGRVVWGATANVLKVFLDVLNPWLSPV